MEKQVILHIGLHRTGTSSFQAAMAEHREDFHAADIDPFLIAPDRPHARELAFACVRPEVFETTFEESARAKLKQQVSHFIKDSPCNRLLFSSEHLSFIRTDAEINDLKAIFGDAEVDFMILVVLREKEEWFRSYKDQILKAKNYVRGPTNSRTNVEDDSWVKDHEEMLNLFKKHFENVEILEYDNFDMTAKLLSALGVESTFNTKAYRRNKRSLRFGRTTYFILRALFGSEGHGPIKAITRARENFLKYRGR